MRGYYHPSEGVLAYPVFWPDESGDRLHPWRGRYRKDVKEFNEKIFSLHPEYRHNFVPRNCPLVPWSDIDEVLHPRSKTRIFLEREKRTVWHAIILYLAEKLSVPLEDIGIFGSYLVDLNRNMDGQHVKDVDIAIYGFDNFVAVKNGMEKLLHHFGFGHISEDHIRYHAEKFGREFSPRANSFEKTLANKWSSIQIRPGLLSTLRFVYKENEIPPNPVQSGIVDVCRIVGEVTDDSGCNFVPRVFRVNAGGTECTVVTYCWAFQACVKKGDRVAVTGNLHEDRRTVSIDAPQQGIKIL